MSDAISAAFAAMRDGVFVSARVAVIADGTTAMGLRLNGETAGALADVGYTSQDSESVIVLSGEIGTLINGKQIAVGGEVAEVVMVKPRRLGAMLRIDYKLHATATGVRPQS